mmetsp:Transcript_32227/g.79849  ORF Transcript_32227/g.79849 Transcript_32227/m.79849 type:complete len:369 (+) Transcript_32227:257-1363(+)
MRSAVRTVAHAALAMSASFIFSSSPSEPTTRSRSLPGCSCTLSSSASAVSPSACSARSPSARESWMRPATRILPSLPHVTLPPRASTAARSARSSATCAVETRTASPSRTSMAKQSPAHATCSFAPPVPPPSVRRQAMAAQPESSQRALESQSECAVANANLSASRQSWSADSAPAMGEESVLPLALLACSRLTTAVGMASAQCSAQASPPCPSRSSTRLGRSEASRWQRRTVLSSMRSAPLRPGDASEAPSTRRERARTCCPDSAAERGREAEAAGGCARTEPACSAGSGGGGGARWTICKASVLPLTADTPICVRTASRCAKALTTAERPAEVPAGRPASAAAASSEAEAADMLERTHALEGVVLL